MKLFYGASDRGVWSLGTKYILKERSDAAPNFETQNVRFLKDKTTIPVPAIIEEWTEENRRHFLLSKRIPGEPLSTAWATMTETEKERVAQQTANYLSELRRLQSPRMQSLDGQPIYSAFLFPTGYGVPHGPLGSDDELWEEMTKALDGVPEIAKRRLRTRMPPSGPYTFTHGDLTNVNILVENGNLTGIIDWEASGYFPVWWESTCAGISLGADDLEWKTALRKYMPDYTEAREFWRDFDALTMYPEVNERAAALLTEDNT